MSETTTRVGYNKFLWLPNEVQSDLRMAGLEDLEIHLGFPCGHFGFYKREPFNVSWIKDKLLMVSMRNDGPLLEQLAEAYSKVVEYKPFCKYTEPLGGLKTYEWAKHDSKERHIQLLVEGKLELLILN